MPLIWHADNRRRFEIHLCRISEQFLQRKKQQKASLDLWRRIWHTAMGHFLIWIQKNDKLACSPLITMIFIRQIIIQLHSQEARADKKVRSTSNQTFRTLSIWQWYHGEYIDGRVQGKLKVNGYLGSRRIRHGEKHKLSVISGFNWIFCFSNFLLHLLPFLNLGTRPMSL